MGAERQEKIVEKEKKYNIKTKHKSAAEKQNHIFIADKGHVCSGNPGYRMGLNTL